MRQFPDTALPKSVWPLAEAAAEKFPENVDAAVDAAVQTFRALPDHEQIVDALVRTQLRNLVHHFRHKANVAAKKGAGLYGGPAKVYRTDAVNEVYKKLLEEEEKRGRRPKVQPPEPGRPRRGRRSKRK